MIKYKKKKEKVEMKEHRLVKQDKKQRERVQREWAIRMQNKAKKIDQLSPERQKAGNEVRQGLKAKPTEVRNRCVVTGRSRSVIRWFRMTGLVVREKGLKGELPGRYKVSW